MSDEPKNQLAGYRDGLNDVGHPKLLIFDFDGTIADTFEAGVEIFNEIAGELGCRQVSRAEIPQLRDMHTLQLMQFMKIPLTRLGFIARRGCEELRARIDQIRPFPGVSEVLYELRVRGFRLGILTSNTSSNVDRFLQNHELEIFEFVRISSKIMGKARVIRTALKDLELKRSEVLLIGDETRDIEAAKRVGVPIASVSWGYSSRNALKAMNPDFLLDDFEGLLHLLT